MSDAIIVCGGRNFADYTLLCLTLDAIDPRPEIVAHGAATGADALAGHWARLSGATEMAFTANWGRYGPSAGPRRNAEMLAQMAPRLVVAFPGGRGTADMVRKARAAGVPVMEVKP